MTNILFVVIWKIIFHVCSDVLPIINKLEKEGKEWEKNQVLLKADRSHIYTHSILPKA